MNNDTIKRHRELSDKERILLMSYHDRECSLINQWRAKRLLSRSNDAAHFYSSLDEVCLGIKTAFEESTPNLKCSLWEGVSRRIEQEERAAIYLGPRLINKGERPRSMVMAPFGWSMAGGLVAASITVFVVGRYPLTNSSIFPPLENAPAQIASSQPLNNSLARNISSHIPLTNSQRLSQVPTNDDLPRILEPGDPRVGSGSSPFAGGVSPLTGGVSPLTLASSPLNAGSQSRSAPVPHGSVDVDWVRSSGAVRFFSDPTERSTMIWVKKRSPVVRFYSSPVTELTPRIKASTAGSTRYLDQQPSLSER